MNDNPTQYARYLTTLLEHTEKVKREVDAMRNPDDTELDAVYLSASTWLSIAIEDIRKRQKNIEARNLGDRLNALESVT